MNPVVAEPAAQDEIDNALATSRDAGRLRTAVATAFAAIRANPQIAARIGRSQYRPYILTALPYSIIYIEEPGQIRVVAFPHSSRKAGYWKSRLPKT